MPIHKKTTSGCPTATYKMPPYTSYLSTSMTLNDFKNLKWIFHGKTIWRRILKNILHSAYRTLKVAFHDFMCILQDFPTPLMSIFHDFPGH